MPSRAKSSVLMHRSKPQRGFTLVEILVAMVITMILVALSFALGDRMLSQFVRVNGENEYSIEASRALDRVVADLETLVIPRSVDGEGLRCELETVNGISVPWLAFLASPQGNDPEGYSASPRAISYRLAYKDPIFEEGSVRRFGLYRNIAGSEESFRFASNAENLITDFWDSRPANASDNLLANDVVDLAVRFQRQSDSTWLEPTESGISIKRSGVFEGSTLIPGGVSAIEVSVTVLSRRGAALLRDGRITREVAIAQFGRTFTRRTSLLSHPSL